MFPAIILFDGFCNLCNGSIDFVMKRDKHKVFRYVALQSEAGVFMRKKFEISEETDSLILWQNGKFYFYSDAVLLIAKQLRFPWSVFAVFFVLPVFIRNAAYRLIARNRYKWFGKRNVCRIPVGDEWNLFPSVTDLELLITEDFS